MEYNNIDMKTELNQLIQELRHKFEILYSDRLVKLILFGSQARGNSLDDSDIDVLVILKGEVSPGKEIARTSELRSELSLKYNTVISCIYISEDRYKHEESPLLLNVHREGIPV